MIEVLHREAIYLWYYFDLQLRQILPYWILGIVLGSVISVFVKDRIHGLFRSLGGRKLGVLGVIPASILGIASPLCMYGTIPLAASFSKSGIRDDWLAAFMMSSILLNPQLIFYSTALGGGALAIRIISCFLCGIAAGLLIRIFYREKPFFNFSGFDEPKSRDTDPNMFWRLLKNIGRNIKATGFWFLIGIMLSALFQRYVPAEFVSRLFGENEGFFPYYGKYCESYHIKYRKYIHKEGEFKMLFTSGYDFEGYEIVSYIGHESAQVVLGTGIFSSFDVSLSDLLGKRSNAYEDKLATAEQMAKERLKEKALNRGGNAVIGIDVDYTTFTNDVIGIIVGGTIVKIEKKIPEKEVKRIPNMEYNMSVPFRILDCIMTYKIASNEIYMSLYGKSYLENKMKGLEVKIALETIFHDVIEIKNNVFADIQINENKEMVTEYNKLEMESSIFKTLKAASIQIVKYITDKKEVLEVPAAQNEKINVTPEQLVSIRTLYGNDAIGKAYKKDSGWVCYCGGENTSSEQICKYCERKIDVEMLRPMKNEADTDTFDLDEHMIALNALKNATEIYEYLVGLKCPDIYFDTVILPEMKKYIALERLYGDMKDSALEKLKELWHNY